MPALRQFRAISDPNNLIAAPVFSTYINGRALAANTNEDETVPSGAKIVAITPTVDCYIEPGGTAAVPTDVTDGSGSLLIGAGQTRWFALDDVANIGLISAATCLVTLEYYK